ncbi:MAG: DUF5677 domain-containing protein [Smithella sp.]|nr:DUF5677 domain-containing protein [Smithella sp.]
MKQLRDIVQFEDSSTVKSNLANQSQMLLTLEACIKKQQLQDNLAISLINLVRKATIEIRRLATFYPDVADISALCARNLFEINLIARAIIESEHSLNAWLGQRASDEIDVITGMLQFINDESSTDYKKLESRRAEIQHICSRHNIKPTKPFIIRNLACQFNLEKEYDALYKLFSKYIHPSSWLINGDSPQLESSAALNIFIICAQLYASELYSRVSEKLKIST